MKLYLVRHGESEGNHKRIYCGHTNVELTQKGVLQAQNMAMLFKDIHIEKIYSSPLIRAYNTAIEISKLKNIEIETSDLLKERYFGDFEGLNWEEIESKYPEEAKKCIEQEIWYEYKNGETFDNVIKRVSKFLENITDNSVIVAHGVLIRSILYYLNFIGYDNMYEYPIGNCHVLFIEDDKIHYLNR